MLASASSVSADGASNVALIDTTRLYAPNGIAEWRAARARLDAERTTFVAVESPDGQRQRLPVPDLKIDPASKERLRKRFEEIERDAEQQRAWSLREAEVLDPIRASVTRALELYARTHGIGLLLDRSELGKAVLVIAPGADITDAFIKSYDAGPSVPAKSKPKK